MFNVNSRHYFRCYFPVTVNILKYENPCFARRLYLRNYLRNKEMNSPYRPPVSLDNRVISYSVLVYFINVLYYLQGTENKR